MGLWNFFKGAIGGKIAAILSTADRDEWFSALEEQLILADVSAPLAATIVGRVRQRAGLSATREEVLAALSTEILAHLPLPRLPSSPPPGSKEVYFLVGVNGSGKTTTAAKLAQFHRRQGRQVMMAAADTFRAAGSSQLSLWGERLGIPVIGGDRGADPGSVVFNATQSFVSRPEDLLVVDTAGRVQTRENLMRELEKLTRIVQKFFPEGPAAVLLVLDAATGQNALSQAERFVQFSGINGIVLSKLDGTARGGAVLTVCQRLNIPVEYVGTGEGADDLAPFVPAEFVTALLAAG